MCENMEIIFVLSKLPITNKMFWKDKTERYTELLNKMYQLKASDIVSELPIWTQNNYFVDQLIERKQITNKQSNKGKLQ